MAKSGHHFPSAAGFGASTGKTTNVKAYTRKLAGPVKKAIGGMAAPPRVMSSPKTPPMPMAGPLSGKMPFPGPRSSPKTPPMPMPPPKRIPLTPRGPSTYADGGYVKEGQGTMKTEEIGDQGNAVQKRGNPPNTTADKEYGGTGPLRTGYKKGGKIPPSFKKAPLFGKK